MISLLVLYVTVRRIDLCLRVFRIDLIVLNGCVRIRRGKVGVNGFLL